MQLAVDALLPERLPSGDIQHPDQAEKTGQLFDLSVEQDETIWLLNQDGARAKDFVHKAVAVMARSRLRKCPWWNYSCKRKQKEVLSPFSPDPKTASAGSAPGAAGRSAGAAAPPP